MTDISAKARKRTATGVTALSSLVVLASLCLLSAVLLPPALAAPKEKGWQLLQFNDDQGIFKTKISERGVRIDSDQFTILILAPSFAPVIYNNSNKRFFDDKIQNSNRSHPYKKFSKVGDERLGTMPVAHYKTIRQATGAVTMEVWTLKSARLPQKMIESCIKCMALSEIPMNIGLPVKVVGHGARGRQHVFMDVKEAKLVDFEAASFQGPKGYKKVTDFVSLQADPDMAGGDDDLSDLLGDRKIERKAAPKARSAHP